MSQTSSFPWIRAASTDNTSTDFATLVPTATKPEWDGSATDNPVVDLTSINGGGSAQVPDLVNVIPYGSNASNEDFKLRIYGWSSVSDADDTSISGLWIPTLLCELTVTLGNIAASLGATTFLPDTITQDTGSTTLHHVVTYGSDLPGAYFLLDPVGSELLEFDFDLDAGGTAAASGNVLLRGFG